MEKSKESDVFCDGIIRICDLDDDAIDNIYFEITSFFFGFTMVR